MVEALINLSVLEQPPEDGYLKQISIAVGGEGREHGRIEAENQEDWVVLRFILKGPRPFPRPVWWKQVNNVGAEGFTVGRGARGRGGRGLGQRLAALMR